MSGKRKSVIQFASIVAERDGGWRCAYCGIPVVERYEDIPPRKWIAFNGRNIESVELARTYQVDHVIAKARGGTDNLDNLVLVCDYCNASKGAKTAEEYMMYLSEKAGQP